jgi:hypothetical protein
LFFFLPLLFESCYRLQFHWAINSEGLWPNLSNDGCADNLKFIELAGFYQAFAITSVKFCLQLHIHFITVLSDKGKHVLVDNIESIPSASQSLQTCTRYNNGIHFYELSNFHKSVSDGFLLTYLAEHIDNRVAECLLEVYNMSNNLLELKPVIGLELI